MYTKNNAHVLNTLKVCYANPQNTEALLAVEKDDNVDLVVSAIIFNNNKVLVQRHVKLGMMTLPSGKVDPGEDIKVSLVREIFEETGARITSSHLVSLSTRYNSLTERKLLDFMFIVELDREPINAEPEKHYSQEFESIFDFDITIPRSQALLTATTYLCYTEHVDHDFFTPIDRTAKFTDICKAMCKAAPEVKGYHKLKSLGYSLDAGTDGLLDFYRYIGISSPNCETQLLDHKPTTPELYSNEPHSVWRRTPNTGFRVANVMFYRIEDGLPVNTIVNPTHYTVIPYFVTTLEVNPEDPLVLETEIGNVPILPF